MADAEVKKKRTFRKYTYRGVDLDQLLDMSSEQLTELFSCRVRRRFQRGLKRKPRMDCVYKCCLYDTEGFINKERFDLLCQPLIDQLDNQIGGESVYIERTSSHLVPCIVQLALAAQDDSLWKALNYQVCLKTRSQEPQVKIGALQVLDTLHKKLGDDYMSLLPETVPFLAELMEDESDEVEQKCQEVIREMEKTLGEPLQKYF